MYRSGVAPIPGGIDEEANSAVGADHVMPFADVRTSTDGFCAIVVYAIA
jgi:hypothetical protein